MKEIFKTIIQNSIALPIPSYTSRELVVPDIDNMSISITGSRRCGKTFRTYQYINDLLSRGVKRENICRIQFNDHRIVSFPSTEFHVIDDAYYSLYPEKRYKESVWFIFDEIHRVEGWEDYVLYLIENPLQKVLITGSTSKLLRGDISSSLRGKNFPVSLYPFSFHEFLRHYDVKIDFISSEGKSILNNCFNRFLKQGGFPGLLDLSETMHVELLQNYWDTMILKDIIEAHPDDNINITSFTRFYKSLLSRISKPMSINKIVNEMKQFSIRFSAETIYRYLEYLKDAFLVYTLEIFSESENIRAQNYKKVYTVDWALGNAVSPGMHKSISRSFENMIFLELKRRGYSLSYYKTRQGYEVDFVAVKNHPQLLELYQVCYDLNDSDVKERELRALVKSAGYLNSSANFIISGDHEESITINQIPVRIIPAWKWLAS